MPLVLQPVDISGAATGAPLIGASLTDLEWTLNGHGGGSLTLPWYEAGALLSPTGETRSELQVIRDGIQLAWLVPTSARLVKGVWSVELAGVTSWLEQRVVGPVVKDPFLANNGFDLGTLTGWSTVACTAAASTTRTMGPGSSARLTAPTGAGTASTGLDSYIYQQFASPVNAEGTVWWATAWVYIEDWTNYALNRRGLTISRIATGNVLMGFERATLTGNDERAKWIRLRTPPVFVPPGESETIEIRCYCPEAVVYWDRAYAIRQDSRSHIGETAWTIMTDLVDHAQDPVYGKDALNITVSGESTATFDRVYLYSDHQEIWTAIRELVGEIDGPDVRVVGRDIQVMDPRRNLSASFGTLRGGHAAGGLNRTVEIADYDLSIDWGRRTSATVALGSEGSGADREEGGYLDESASAPITERVLSTTVDTPAGDLARYAQGQVQPLVAAFTVKVVPTVGTDLLAAISAGIFFAGDVVTIDLRDETGAVIVDGDWQAASVRMDGADETLTLTLNPVPAAAV